MRVDTSLNARASRLSVLVRRAPTPAGSADCVIPSPGRQGAGLSNFFTVAKLLPLLVLIAAGAIFILRGGPAGDAGKLRTARISGADRSFRGFNRRDRVLANDSHRQGPAH